MASYLQKRTQRNFHLLWVFLITTIRFWTPFRPPDLMLQYETWLIIVTSKKPVSEVFPSLQISQCLCKFTTMRFPATIKTHYVFVYYFFVILSFLQYLIFHDVGYSITTGRIVRLWLPTTLLLLQFCMVWMIHLISIFGTKFILLLSLFCIPNCSFKISEMLLRFVPFKSEIASRLDKNYIQWYYPYLFILYLRLWGRVSMITYNFSIRLYLLALECVLMYKYKWTV